MNHENYDIQFEEWLLEQSKPTTSSLPTKGFIGDRPYRHFDARVQLSELESNHAEKLKNELRRPNKLSTHAFYPFVRKDKKVRRYVQTLDTTTLEKGIEIKQKNRPIMYASHRDAVIFGFYGWMLKSVYNKRLVDEDVTNSVIAYRKIPRNDGSGKNKSNIDFANDIFRAVGNHEKAAIMCLDVSNFFGTMSHKKLETAWKDLLNVDSLPIGHKTVFRNITRYRYIFVNDVLVALNLGSVVKGKFEYKKSVRSIDRSGPLTKTSRIYNSHIKKLEEIKINTSPRGIPQGSPISDVLANMYLLDFDKAMASYVDSNNMGLYRRYSDDILLILPVDQIEKVYKDIKSRFKLLDLKINESKTELFILDRAKNVLKDSTSLIVKDYVKNKTAVQYLGFEFDLRDINIRSGTVANYYRKFIRSLKRNEQDDKDPYIVISPKDSSIIRSRKQRDRYGYIKTAGKRIGSDRLKSQFSNVRKRTARLRRKSKQVK